MNQEAFEEIRNELRNELGEAYQSGDLIEIKLAKEAINDLENEYYGGPFPILGLNDE